MLGHGAAGRRGHFQRQGPCGQTRLLGVQLLVHACTRAACGSQRSVRVRYKSGILSVRRPASVCPSETCCPTAPRRRLHGFFEKVKSPVGRQIRRFTLPVATRELGGATHLCSRRIRRIRRENNLMVHCDVRKSYLHASVLPPFPLTQ